MWWGGVGFVCYGPFFLSCGSSTIRPPPVLQAAPVPTPPISLSHAIALPSVQLFL